MVNENTAQASSHLPAPTRAFEVDGLGVDLELGVPYRRGCVETDALLAAASQAVWQLVAVEQDLAWWVGARVCVGKLS